ncbi:MAG: TonB-dependent receptor [Bacteroidales bacterium]
MPPAYFFKNRVTASLYYKFSGKYPEYVYTATEGISLRYLNPYHNMDLNASVKCFRQKVRVSAGVKNLMNNTRLSGIQGSSGHGGGDGVSSLVGWGRTFFLGIQYNFHKY